MRGRCRSIPRSRPTGFTLVELLVVITIIAISLVAIVPAFGRIVESANHSAAVNRVTAALSLARNEAMNGRETALAFLFDQETERTSLLVLVQRPVAGVLTSGSVPTSGCDQSALVYEPLAGQAPIVLPKGFGVYGLSLSANPDEIRCQGNEFIGWYRNEAARRQVFGNSMSPVERFWLFPRNDARLFVDDELWPELEEEPAHPAWLDVARYAETFFVRFDQSGKIVPSVELGAGANLLNAYIEYAAPTDSGDIIPNPNESAGVFDPEEFEFDDTRLNRYRLNREAQVRSVDMIAVVDFTRLADETGIGAPWLVIPEPALGGNDSNDSVPDFLSPNDRKAAFIDGEFAADSQNPPVSPASFIHRVSRWIDANAEIISFNRSTGEAMRRTAQ